MKRIFSALLLIFISTSLISFTSCTDQPAENDPIVNGTGENSNPLGTTHTIDAIQHVYMWKDPATTFDKTTGTLTVPTHMQGVGIWLTDTDKSKASELNYLEIKYKNATTFFWVYVYYKDETKSYVVCPVEETTAYLELDPMKKNQINGISIVSLSSNFQVVLESFKFTEKRPAKVQLSPVVDTKTSGSFDSNVSAVDFAKRMKIGWNLGNTLDASPDPQFFSKEECAIQASAAEGLWDEIYTTKAIIDYPKTQGYSTIRIPVTWFCHIIDDKYTIDPVWMTRVKQIVDWAIEDGYYVILNEHHSVRDNMHSPIEYGEGYIPRNTPEDIAESERFLKAIWTQICAAFNNSYDEHLIFETMNEPRNTMHETNQKHNQWETDLDTWSITYNCAECRADYEIVNKYNQICVDTIRASGGNNAKRFILIPTLVTSDRNPMHELFKIPTDTAQDKLMLTVHNYIWNKTPLGQTFTDDMKSRITTIYSDLNTKFISKGIPVVIGETGADRIYDLQERIKWMKFYAKLVSGYGIPLVQWDGGDDKGVCQYDRVNLKFKDPTFIQAIFDSWKCE